MFFKLVAICDAKHVPPFKHDFASVSFVVHGNL